MSYGFNINGIQSGDFGLSYLENVTLSPGQKVSKTYPDMDGYDFDVFVSVVGDLPVSAIPAFPSFSVYGNTITLDASAANVTTDCTVLCR